MPDTSSITLRANRTSVTVWLVAFLLVTTGKLVQESDPVSRVAWSCTGTVVLAGLVLTRVPVLRVRDGRLHYWRRWHRTSVALGEITRVRTEPAGKHTYLVVSLRLTAPVRAGLTLSRPADRQRLLAALRAAQPAAPSGGASRALTEP